MSAVSAAFKRPQHLSREVREKILAAALDMGYFSAKTEVKNIGLLFNNFHDHFFGEYYNEIIYGIMERLSQLNLRCQIFNKVPEKYADICELHGFLVVGNNTVSIAKPLLDFKMPTVLVECTKKEAETFSRIYFDNYSGVKQLTDYLLYCGHHNIAVLNGETDPEDFFWKNFQKAILDSFAENNVSSTHMKFYQADYSNIQTVELNINKILSTNKNVSCIMCSNDLFAYQTLKILSGYGIKVPEQISLTGFDGINLPFYLNEPEVKLTTVFADRTDISKQAVDLLLQVIPDKKMRIVKMETKLLIGKSVKRLRV